MELRDISITEYDLMRLKELAQVGISFGEYPTAPLSTIIYMYCH